MGLYKLCEHKGRARDRCDHAWWARFRHVRVSLKNLQAAAARLERGETFDPGARDSTSPAICQASVKSSADANPGEQIDRLRETGPSCGDIWS